MFRLVVTRSDGKKLEFFAEGDAILIGRAPLVNDVCIDDPSISRQHVKLKQKKDHVLITDLESQNGILVDGQRVTKAKLPFGQAMMLGHVTVEVYVQNQAIRLERVTKETARQRDVLLRPIDETASSQNLGKETLTEADNVQATDIPKKK